MPDRHASFAAAMPRDQGLAESDGRRWQVLLPLPLAGAYDYWAPRGLAIELGSFVTAPLGGRLVPGVVWGEADGTGVAAERLKPIDSVLEVPEMSETLRRFVDWVAAYTVTPPGAVLRMTMSVSDALVPPRPVAVCTLTDAGRAALLDEAAGHRLTPARRRVLAELRDGPSLPIIELARAAGCGASVVRG